MGTTTGTRVLCTQYLLRVANDQTIEEMETFKSEAGILSMFSKLAQALTDNNNSDVSTPPHFTGKDEEWETW